MTYRIIDDATGHILRSIDASEEIALLYLKAGQHLVRDDGQIMVDDSVMKVEDGIIVRRAQDEMTLDSNAGEGVIVELVATATRE